MSTTTASSPMGAVARALDELESAVSSDAEAIDAIRALEDLKSVAAAAQARLTVRLHRARLDAAPDRTKPGEIARGVGAEVGLARRESPARGRRRLGFALALEEMPQLSGSLSRGEVSEWRAELVVRETACLTREHRAAVDQELHSGRLESLGDRRVADLARSIAYRMDPGAALRRTRQAESDRRVTIRPAPDTMCYLTALLPVAQGVAVYAALRRVAEHRNGEGDPRSLGQVMADTVVERLTGRVDGIAAVELQLVMSDRTLFGRDHEPAHLQGHGALPAAVARRLVRASDKVWVRRLYAAPGEGRLVSMDSRRRVFSGRLRELLVLRDQTCRTPWCDAPVRHLDHIRPAASGGATTADNGEGLCEACNYAKQVPGFRAAVVSVHGHVVELTTPTGHRYRTRAPAQPGTGLRGVEQRARDLLDDTG